MTIQNGMRPLPGKPNPAVTPQSPGRLAPAASRPAALRESPARALRLFDQVDSDTPITKGRLPDLRIGTYVCRIESHGSFQGERNRAATGVRMTLTVLGVVAERDETGRLVMPQGAPPMAVAQGFNQPGTEVSLVWFTDSNGFFESDMKRMFVRLGQPEESIDGDFLSKAVDSLDDNFQPLTNDDGSPWHTLGGMIVEVTRTIAIGKKPENMGQPIYSKGGDLVYRTEFERALRSSADLDECRSFIPENIWKKHLEAAYLEQCTLEAAQEA